VVCVGGGGGGGRSAAGGGGGALAWGNNYCVRPGRRIQVVVGARGADGAAGGHSWFASPATLVAGGGSGGGDANKGAGGVPSVNASMFLSGTGGGQGGDGGDTDSFGFGGGGGGAGGYTGRGGSGGGLFCPTAAAGGGGGAGQFREPALAGSGGGVGLRGEGSNGAGACNDPTSTPDEGSCCNINPPDKNGGGGSGGDPGSDTGGGGAYGGGGGNRQASEGATIPGGPGGCRIIWGANRAFPTTNVA